MMAERACADWPLLKANCAECHNDEKAKGKFNLSHLGEEPTNENLDRWVDVLDLVSAAEMPPEDDVEISEEDRSKLVAFVKSKLKAYDLVAQNEKQRSKPRRLNNREFANSVRDVCSLRMLGRITR